MIALFHFIPIHTLDILLALKDAGFLLRQTPRGADSFGEFLLLMALEHLSLDRLKRHVLPSV